MPLDVIEFVRDCHRAAKHKPVEDRPRTNWYEMLDQIGKKHGVAPRFMMQHAVNHLRHVSIKEVEDHPGLAVAHWLVLAELVPTDEKFRRNWAIRTQEMGFTAKQLRSELQAGLAALARQSGA